MFIAALRLVYRERSEPGNPDSINENGPLPMIKHYGQKSLRLKQHLFAGLQDGLSSILLCRIVTSRRQSGNPVPPLIEQIQLPRIRPNMLIANGAFPPRAPLRPADPGAPFLDAQAPGAVQRIAGLSSGLPEPDVVLPEDVAVPGAFVPAGVQPAGHSDGSRVGQALHAWVLPSADVFQSRPALLISHEEQSGMCDPATEPCRVLLLV